MPLPTGTHAIDRDLARQMLSPINGFNGGVFNKAIFKAILEQNNCEGIRFYFAKKTVVDQEAVEFGVPNGKIVPTIVIVGVDAQGNDLPTLYGENSWPCPPHCGGTNALQ